MRYNICFIVWSLLDLASSAVCMFPGTVACEEPLHQTMWDDVQENSYQQRRSYSIFDQFCNECFVVIFLPSAGRLSRYKM